MNFILFPPIFLQNRIVLTTCCIRRMCTLEQKEVWLESAKWCGLWSSHLWNPPSSTIIPVPPICVSEMTPTLIQVLNSAPPRLLCLYMCINIQCLSSQQPLHQACVITSVKAMGIVVRSMDPGPRLLGFKSQLCCWLLVWPWPKTELLCASTW